MGSIYKEFVIEAPVKHVWAALRDVVAIPTRLVPDLVVDTTMEGDTRIVTFSNGLIVREKIVDIDDERRRVAYSASGGGLTYHHASMQVLPDGGNRSRFIWITDLQPDTARNDITALIDKGSEIMRRHLRYQ